MDDVVCVGELRCEQLALKFMEDEIITCIHIFREEASFQVVRPCCIGFFTRTLLSNPIRLSLQPGVGEGQINQLWEEVRRKIAKNQYNARLNCVFRPEIVYFFHSQARK